MFQESYVLFQSISYWGNVTNNIECHDYVAQGYVAVARTDKWG